MFTASAKFRPALAWFARQIAPSVLATLIAALVIAGYNRAFMGHLQQPRMAALHAAIDGATAAPVAAEADTGPKPKPAWTTQVTEIIPPREELDRSFDKDEGREAAKDQSKVRVADVPPAATAPAAVVARPLAARPEPRAPEPRVVGVDRRSPMPQPASGGYLAVQQPLPQPIIVQQPLQPIAVAPAPVLVPVAPAPIAAAPVAQEPPPVITAAKPMVTVPDRPGLRPAYETQAPAQAQPVQDQSAPPSPQRPGVLGTIVDTLKPSSLFRSAREFGDKIEAAGNDILPNIRQQ
jgi:hypothetical protein